MKQSTTMALALLLAMRALAGLPETFENPPQAAEARTWWHWLDGNVSREGITKDLEAMKRAGIGGFQLFHVGRHAPLGEVAYMSDEWRALAGHAAREANRLGLEFAMHNGPGWANSGGPWVTPELSMQELAWTETAVPGGQPVSQKLPQPATREGHYRDIATFAIRQKPEEGNALVHRNPKMSGTLPDYDGAEHRDQDWERGRPVPDPDKGGEAWIVADFGKAFTARSAMVVFAPHRGEPSVTIEVSDDGTNYRPLASLTTRHYGGAGYKMDSDSFDAATGRYFRYNFGGKGAPVRELFLSAAPIANGLGERSGLVKINSTIEPMAAIQGGISPEDILDISDKLAADGTLRWDAPQGDWIILRIGHTTTGSRNRPAEPSAEGLECDKLSREAMDLHFANTTKRIIEEVGDLAGKSFKFGLIDSFEVGAQNWTPKMPEEFERRAGYPLGKHLVKLTGRIVGSAVETERFLYDYRKTIAALFADNYYGYYDELLARHGMGTYFEAYHNGNFDSMAAAGRADVPMTEFWSGRADFDPQWVKTMISAANVYGKPVVAAEAFTTSPKAWPAWSNHPRRIKAQGDAAYCEGVNQLVFHTFAHQPWPDHVLPGMTMGWWGTQFHRNNTWYAQADGWLDYLARCQHLLQKGQTVCDVLVFAGEQVPNHYVVPELPDGWEFDWINDEPFLERLQAKDGKLLLPGGKTYDLLVLPQDDRMSLKVLQKLGVLLQGGAVVIGAKPLQGWSLNEDHNAVRTLADKLWAKHDIRDEMPEAALRRLGIRPDFLSSREDTLFIHKRLPGREIYFVSNQADEPVELTCTFRAAASAVEFWNPMNGRIHTLPHQRTAGGHTVLNLPLQPHGSGFVVFGDASPKARSDAPNLLGGETLQQIGSPWTVAFDPKWKAPASIQFPKLISWPEHPDEFIKYYSGAATYRTTFDFQPAAGHRPPAMYLDLGDVEVMARVKLNGRDLGVLWKKPYRVNISDAVQDGENTLEVEVVNLWINRLIGDQQYPDDRKWSDDAFGGMKNAVPAEHPPWQAEFFRTGKRPSQNRLTYANWNHYSSLDFDLVPSGLLGPVMIVAASGGPSDRREKRSEIPAAEASEPLRGELAPDGTGSISLGGVWDFQLGRHEPDAVGWSTVAVPHSWNARDGQDGVDPVTKASYHRGPGTYLKTINPGEAFAGKRLFLRFEGVANVAEVFLNGHLAGNHRGGYTPFTIEVTDLIVPNSANTLRVVADNSPFPDVSPLSGDFTQFGGLYRPVSLLVKHPVCFSPLVNGSHGVFLRQESVSTERAVLRVTSRIDNGLDRPASVEIRCRLVDREGKTVATASQPADVPAGENILSSTVLEVNQPRLWHGTQDPYLYQVEVDLMSAGKVVDRFSMPQGFRFYHVDPKKGFFLNGEPYRLRGVNMHQSRKDKGYATSPEDREEDLAIIAEMGANAVRLAHYPHAENVYAMADRMGLVVTAELPIVNAVTVSGEFDENALQQMNEIIDVLGNHTSVFTYALQNELHMGGGSPPATPILTRLQRLCKERDPTRPTYGASNMKTIREEPSLVTIPDLCAFNLYPGWYGRDASSSLANLLPKMNEIAEGKGFAISEYGAGASVHHHEDPPTKPRTKGPWHPEEYQSQHHEDQWRIIRDTPYVWGSFVWNMFDFAADQRSEGDRPGINDKGLVTDDRRVRKDAFWFYKANWSTAPVLHLTSRRHIRRQESPVRVKAYSNVGDVTLILNGATIATVSPDDLKRAIFPSVPLKPGENTVRVEAGKMSDEAIWILSGGGASASEHGTSSGETATE